MKQIIIALVICALTCTYSYGQDLKTEKILELNYVLDPAVLAGTKIIYANKSGTARGKINGKILSIGGDFGTLLTPTTFKLDVRAVIQTEDSATIYITYTGFIYTDEETFKLMASGNVKNLSPDKYYFRINPIFETTSPKYDWLNHTVAIGVGTRTITGVSYKIYAIK
jgi:Protein of unknown function (DUF3237).